MFANPSVLPPICSAKTYAASLADGRSSAYKRDSTVWVSPATRLQVTYPDGIFEIAFSVTITGSERLEFSKTTIAVIIFVVLAGYIFCLEFFSYIIFPVLNSTNIAALPFIGGFSVIA